MSFPDAASGPRRALDRAADRQLPPVGTRPPAVGARIRALMARRPMATFLVMAYAGFWASWMPVLFLGAPPRPFTFLGALIGLALPAVTVTAAIDGREGVRDLLRRAVHWRVGVPWYLFALFAVPAGMLLLALLIFDAQPRGSSGGDPAGLLPGLLLDVLLALITVQLFEELGWTGFVQHRLQARYRPMRATLLVAVAFALIHLPTYFQTPITGQHAAVVLAQMLPFLVFAAFFRVLLTWLYNATACSILLAALLHASFNAASSSSFYGQIGPDRQAGLLPLAVVAVLAITVAAATKGRLGLRTDSALAWIGVNRSGLTGRSADGS